MRTRAGKIRAGGFALFTVAVLGLFSGDLTAAPRYEEGPRNLLIRGNFRVGAGGATPDLALNDTDVFVEGSLEVNGATRLDGTVAINGALSPTGDVSVTGALEASGSITSLSDVTASDDITATDDLVGEDAVITDLVTTADLLATDDVQVNDDLIVGDTADVTTLKLASTTVNSTATEIDAVASLSTNGARIRTVVLTIASTPTGSEQDTGYDIPVNALVTDCAIYTTTAEATAADKRMHVGILSTETGGDLDGFMANVTVATVGPTATCDTLSVNNSTEDWIASTTRGVLLGQFTAGSNSAGDVGTSNRQPFAALATRGRSVVYDVEGADWGEWRGKIVLTLQEF